MNSLPQLKRVHITSLDFSWGWILCTNGKWICKGPSWGSLVKFCVCFCFIVERSTISLGQMEKRGSLVRISSCFAPSSTWLSTAFIFEERIRSLTQPKVLTKTIRENPLQRRERESYEKSDLWGCAVARNEMKSTDPLEQLGSLWEKNASKMSLEKCKHVQIL